MSKTAAPVVQPVLPAPVPVEIVLTPPHSVCTASIVVHNDQAADQQHLYSLRVGQQDCVFLTEAQLAAVLFAGAHLVRPPSTQPRGVAS